MTVTHLDAHLTAGRTADKHAEALAVLHGLASKRANLSPRQRSDVAEALVQFSRAVVYAVREQGPEDIERMLAPRELQPFMRDLVIVLACLVPDDRTYEDLLSWTTWDWDTGPSAFDPTSSPTSTDRRSA